MRDDRQRALDILEAIERIIAKSPVSLAELNVDEMLQVWMLHHLRIIGEAARAISDDTHTAIPEVPWRQIVGMRHILVRDYFNIDAEIVWSVLQNDLTPLQAAVENWLSKQE